MNQEQVADQVAKLLLEHGTGWVESVAVLPQERSGDIPVGIETQSGENWILAVQVP